MKDQCPPYICERGEGDRRGREMGRERGGRWGEEGEEGGRREEGEREEEEYEQYMCNCKSYMYNVHAHVYILKLPETRNYSLNYCV